MLSIVIIDAMELKKEPLATCVTVSPSVLHRPAKADPLPTAVKKSVPLKSVSRLIWLLPVLGLMSVSRTVPASVPSVRQSSSPCVSVVAQKNR